MHFDLTSDQTALVEARMETDRRIRADLEKSKRCAERRRLRIERELANNNGSLMAALSRSLSVKIPQGAVIGLKADGVGVVEWPDPPSARRSAAPIATDATPETDAPEASITPMPTNGSLVGASP